MSLDKKSLENFVRKGIISEHQMDQMLAETTISSKLNFGDIIGKIVLIGSVLFGFGIITFIATNWEIIPDGIKIAGTLLLIFASYVGATLLDNKYNLPKISEGTFLIGGLATGGLFALISQIYNIDSGNYSGLLLIWFIAILVPAYLFNSKMLSILTAILFSASTTTFILERLGNTYEFKHLSLVLITQILVFMIGGLHYKFHEHYGIGRLYRLTALTFGTITMLFLTFSRDWFFYGEEVVQNFQPELLYPVAAVVALSAISYFGKFFDRNRFHFANLLLIIISILAYFQMTTTGENAYLVYSGMNILFILSLIFTLYVSVLEKDRGIMNFGIVVSCLYIFSKSISWLEMLNGYVFFMAIGLIFILVGYIFERIRKQLIEQINN